ncbi:MAG: DUF4234 domain-containing protein [bacterium]
MQKIRGFFGKIRIEYLLLGLGLLSLITFGIRFYACRLNGSLILTLNLNEAAIGTTLGWLFSILILDGLFATIGFMAFDQGYSKRAKLSLLITFAFAALLFVANLLWTVLNDNLIMGTLTIYGLDYKGGFAFGFYFYIFFLLAFGVVLFLHPGYAGADEPTLWGFLLRKLNKRDILVVDDRGMDPVLFKKLPIAIFYTIISLGFYGIIWLLHLIKSFRRIHNQQGSPVGEFLLVGIAPIVGFVFLSLLFIGLNVGYLVFVAVIVAGAYPGYWLFKHEKELCAKASELKLDNKHNNSVMYLVLALLGLAIVPIVLMQHDFNKAAKTVVIVPAAEAIA